jgi:anti-sigma factor RsiW
MPDMQISDEVLMAYADRELDAAEAKAVEKAVAEDPELARRLALFHRTRAEAREAFAEIVAEPVPPELEARVKAMVAEHQRSSQEPVAAGKLMAPRSASRWWATRPSRSALPLAASLAALGFGVAGYLVGYFTAPSRDGALAVAIGNVEAPGLAEALSQMPSGEERQLTSNGTEPLVRMVASFRDAAGTLCREFELRGAEGPATLVVACRPGPVWTIGFAVTAPSVGNGYAPASATEALDAYVQAIGGDEALTQAEEQAALRSIE